MSDTSVRSARLLLSRGRAPVRTLSRGTRRAAGAGEGGDLKGGDTLNGRLSTGLYIISTRSAPARAARPARALAVGAHGRGARRGAAGGRGPAGRRARAGRVATHARRSLLQPAARPARPAACPGPQAARAHS